MSSSICLRSRSPIRAKALARTTINGLLSWIRQTFRWGVESELVPAAVHEGLRAVAGLKRGRTLAPEPEPVRPVPRQLVEAALPFLSRQVAAMVELQWLTGMRPQEVVQMRWQEVDRTDGVWIYRPREHKLEHHGTERAIPLGPKAQAVLVPFLAEDEAAYLFSPQAAERERRQRQRERRRTKLWASHGNEARRRRRRAPLQALREYYDTASYRRAIARACDRAGVEVWSPNQLRHSAATRIRKASGVEAAQVVLGHSKLETTQVYAETNLGLAVEAMQQEG